MILPVESAKHDINQRGGSQKAPTQRKHRAHAAASKRDGALRNLGSRVEFQPIIITLVWLFSSAWFLAAGLWVVCFTFPLGDVVGVECCLWVGLYCATWNKRRLCV